jgi:hypothetical protein
MVSTSNSHRYRLTTQSRDADPPSSPSKRGAECPRSPSRASPRTHSSLIGQHYSTSLSTSQRSEDYCARAQRMVTLETRLPASTISSCHLDRSLPSHPSAINPVASLEQYGSPSSDRRPSPVSLPSRAKRWVRGPARRPPPNTPDGSFQRDSEPDSSYPTPSDSPESPASDRLGPITPPVLRSENEQRGQRDNGLASVHVEAKSPAMDGVSEDLPSIKSPVRAGVSLSLGEQIRTFRRELR